MATIIQYKCLLVFVYAIAGLSLFNVTTLINQLLFGIKFLEFYIIDDKYKIFVTILCSLGSFSYLGTAIGVQYVLKYGRIKRVHLDFITILRSQESAPFTWRMGRLVELVLLINASICFATNIYLTIVFLSAMNAQWAAITLGCVHSVYIFVALALVLYIFFGFVIEPIPEGCDLWFTTNRDRFMKCNVRQCTKCCEANVPVAVVVPSVSLQVR